MGLPIAAATEQKGRPMNLIGARLDAGLHDCASPDRDSAGATLVFTRISMAWRGKENDGITRPSLLSTPSE